MDFNAIYNSFMKPITFDADVRNAVRELQIKWSESAGAAKAKSETAQDKAQRRNYKIEYENYHRFIKEIGEVSSGLEFSQMMYSHSYSVSMCMLKEYKENAGNLDPNGFYFYICISQCVLDMKLALDHVLDR